VNAEPFRRGRSSEIVIPESIPLPMGVAGKRVVVTGAGRGLGRVLVTAFARAEATVGLVARSEEQLKEVAASLPGEHLIFAGDVNDEAFNLHVASAMAAECGGLDIWIANAGISPVVSEVTTLDAETWRATIATNLTGAFLGAKAASRIMTSGGRVIFTSSVLGQRSMPGLSAYSASKAGLGALVRALALELGPREITVNAVAPGWFDSPLAAGFRQSEKLDRRITAHTALRRWGEASDLPGPYLFLASEAARFITGATIPVDGGYLLP